MISLLTGIPRSGTTLCCSILNKQIKTVALHEPINPNKLLHEFTSPVCTQIIECIANIQRALYSGLPFEVGDSKQGLTLSNPVGLSVNQSTGKRMLQAVRGNITLPEYKNVDVHLIVKQNALFTAYLHELSQKFRTICIVRNPVDVLLSWWTVNLPVSNGRLPAGEKNDKYLKSLLLGSSDVFQRQLHIYEWFCESFYKYSKNTLRYEDIVTSNGLDLIDAYGISNASLSPLQFQERVFSADILQKLHMHKDKIISINTYGYYSPQQITDRLQEVLNN